MRCWVGSADIMFFSIGGLVGALACVVQDTANTVLEWWRRGLFADDGWQGWRVSS